MKKIRILIVDDEEDVIDDFRETLKAVGDNEFELDGATTVEDAVAMIRQFDAAIVDQKMKEGDYAGEEFIRECVSHFRMPIAVYSGVDNSNLKEKYNLLYFVKGDADYMQVLNALKIQMDEPLFRVMGMRGKFDEYLASIYWNHILPKSKLWDVGSGGEVEKTEQVLLRYTCALLQEHIAKDDISYLPEEFYIYPPVNLEVVETGAVYEFELKDPQANDSQTDNLQANGSQATDSVQTQIRAIVMNPPCDLALHDTKDKNGNNVRKPKSEYIVLSIIDDLDKLKTTYNSKTIKSIEDDKCAWAHHLPEMFGVANEGCINFRRIIHLKFEDFQNKQPIYLYKINAEITKNILARFSAYYGRQGQPVLDTNQA